jgi:hypothetical protein
MKRAMPWDEQIDVISSDDSSSSDSEIEVNDGFDNQHPANNGCDDKQPVNDGCDGKQPMNNMSLNQPATEIRSEGICHWDLKPSFTISWYTFYQIYSVGMHLSLDSFIRNFLEIPIQLKLVRLYSVFRILLIY